MAEIIIKSFEIVNDMLQKSGWLMFVPIILCFTKIIVRMLKQLIDSVSDVHCDMGSLLDVIPDKEEKIVETVSETKEYDSIRERNNAFVSGFIAGFFGK